MHSDISILFLHFKFYFLNNFGRDLLNVYNQHGWWNAVHTDPFKTDFLMYLY